MKKISYLLKSSKYLYCLYYYIMSALLRILGCFISVDEKLILFSSFGGKKYDDSPKAIYETMKQNHCFDEYKKVWAFHDPQKMSIPADMAFVKTDSFSYFITALKSKVWITNSSIERGLNFKKKDTFLLNTWHGTPIKLMGSDISDSNQSFQSKSGVSADVMLAQSPYDIDVFSNAFQIPKSDFRLFGLPRNDVLVNYPSEMAASIKSSLGISEDKIVLLYAPTFREFTKGTDNGIVHNIPIDLRKWQSQLGDKFVILFRAHYEVAKHINLDKYPLFKDVTLYPELSNLMIASDALISDYSSIFFDYSIMHKPIYCFAYDYDEYLARRGMYLDLSTELPCMINRNEDSLIAELLQYDDQKERKQEETAYFQMKYVTESGRAAKQSCDFLFSHVFHGGKRQ